jgi:hypothetical protein
MIKIPRSIHVSIAEDPNPRLVFPIFKHPNTQQLELHKIPVIGGAPGVLRCEQIQSHPNFVGWGVNPWTGECKIEIDKQQLTEAVAEWIGNMRPTRGV